MGRSVSTREKGLLKLVHPGRHVEIYKEPVPAAEIMRKYPRHSIARPDVFQFPWIVVRPESVLFPGKVFFLIPNRTLYGLLKGKGLRSISSLRENQNPRQQHDHRGSRRRLVNMLLRDRTNSHDQDSDYTRSDSETSYVDTWTEITDKIRKVHVNSYQAAAYPLDSSFDSCRSFHPRGFHPITSTLPLVRPYGGNHRRTSGAQTQVKSCLRKQDSVRKLLNLRVTFGSPAIIPCRPREIASSRHNFWAWND